MVDVAAAVIEMEILCRKITYKPRSHAFGSMENEWQDSLWDYTAKIGMESTTRRGRPAIYCMN